MAKEIGCISKLHDMTRIRSDSEVGLANSAIDAQNTWIGSKWTKQMKEFDYFWGAYVTEVKSLLLNLLAYQ